MAWLKFALKSPLFPFPEGEISPEEFNPSLEKTGRGDFWPDGVAELGGEFSETGH